MSFAINWLAVLVGVVLSWLIGAGYYMALSRQWLAAIGKSRQEVPTSLEPMFRRLALYQAQPENVLPA